MAGCSFDFESSLSDVCLIKTVVHETIVDLLCAIGKLREIALPSSLDDAVMTSPDLMVGNPVSHEFCRIDQIIPPGCVVADLHAQSQEEAIVELVQHLGFNGHLVDVQKCIRDVLVREKIASTRVDDQISFPHARTSGAKRMVAAIGVSRNGFKEFGDTGNNITMRVILPSHTP